jgi:hypothetical protein
MTTYYVRKAGNDGGDGSTGNPWLTIDHAIKTIPAAGGHTILVGDGTYGENSGGGYLLITWVFTAPVTIRSESSDASKVIIQSASGNSYNTLYQVASGAGFIFEYLTFAMRVKEGPSGAMRIAQGSPVVFNHCKFAGLTDTTQRFGLLLSPSTGATISNVTLTACDFTMVGAQNSFAAQLDPGAGTINNINFVNCTGTAVQYALYVLQGCTNVNVTGGAWTNTGLGAGICYGIDGETRTGAISGTISGATITSNSSHACLLGARLSGVITLTGCTINGGDYGVVVKENSGTVVTLNVIRNGTRGSLYFKGSTNGTATYNTISNSVGAPCFQALQGDTSHQFGNLTITHNLMDAEGTSQIYNIGPLVQDAGGVVSDYNIYYPAGSGLYGAVHADMSVANFAELRAAWAGYGDGSNDLHSYEYTYQRATDVSLSIPAGYEPIEVSITEA